MEDLNEVIREPWRFRAVLVKDIEVEGSDSFPSGPQDVYVWFVGRMDDDEWFAHGISDEFHESDADDMIDTIDGAEMDVMLAYGGLTWNEINSGDAGVLAQLQRNMVTEMHPALKADLMAMGSSEIHAIRLAEEIHADERINRN